MTTSAILLESVTKYYGQQLGVADLNLEVSQGEVFGYLGPNGAGKTTTIRMLLDFIRPTSGKLSILGQDAQLDSVELRRRVGYIPGDPKLYGNLSGRDFLSYLANLREGVNRNMVDSLAERLDCDLSRPIDTLSQGNRQKIAVINAFMHEPEILILDEPTSGLDPLMQQEFDAMILEVKQQGRTVFLSSHILPEVEELCDRVAIIRQGRIVAVATIETLKSLAIRRLKIDFAGPIDPADFSNLPGYPWLPSTHCV
jgi:ABC-2 type transport system ATP-binding protein